jgi:hypothetical protein
METKTVVSVAEMARMVGLSRARFYQLIGTAFPWPLYSVSTRRPFYDEELQTSCLEVRRRNCGIDGRPVLFYCQRATATVPRKKRPVKDDRHAELLDGLKGLGLVNVTGSQVAEAVRELFPRWEHGADQGGVIRALFLHFRRQDSRDNVGR